MRDADAEAKIHFPLRRKVQVDSGKNLVLLLADGKKIGGRADGAVILKSAGDFLGEVVAELEIRREGDSLRNAVAVKGPVKRGIEGEIPGTFLLINDRPNFPGPGIGGEFSSLIADFIGKAQADGPIPLFGNVHAGADVVADPLDALPAFFRSEDVETSLEPVVEAMRDFDGFMQLMIGRKQPVLRGIGALESEIAMELDHSVMRFDQLVGVDLNFVVILRARGSTERGGKKREDSKRDDNP